MTHNLELLATAAGFAGVFLLLPFAFAAFQ